MDVSRAKMPGTLKFKAIILGYIPYRRMFDSFK